MQQNTSAALKASWLHQAVDQSDLKCVLKPWTVERNDVETERLLRNAFDQHQIGALQRTPSRHSVHTFRTRGGAAGLLKGKFHYAILVADRSEAGRRPVQGLLARASSLLAR